LIIDKSVQFVQFAVHMNKVALAIFKDTITIVRKTAFPFDSDRGDYHFSSLTSLINSVLFL